MPYNGSGTFTLAEAAFVPNTVISSTVMNSDLSDLATNGLTNAVTKDGQTTITGAFKGATGSVGLPMYSFSADTDCGMYRIGANNIGLSVNATKIIDIGVAGVAIIGVLTASVAGLDIHGATALTAPAVDDEILTYDLSATANRKITNTNYFTVINAFPADATPDTAADYLVTYDASAAAPKKLLLQNFPVILPRGYIDGCTISNAAGGTTALTFAAGVCRDGTNAVNITSAAMAAKVVANVWSAGAAGGLLDTGSIGNNTYHVYSISKADGTQDYIISLSASVPAYPTGYIYSRIIGSIVRSGGAIVLFTQIGNYFRMKTPIVDGSLTLTTSSQSVALTSVPTGISMQTDMNAVTGVNDAFVYIRCPDDTDSVPSATTNSLSVNRDIGAASTPGFIKVWCNTSAQVAARADNGASTTLKLAVLGYTHPRGQNI